jgi:hypothetical protein
VYDFGWNDGSSESTVRVWVNQKTVVTAPEWVIYLMYKAFSIPFNPETDQTI